MAQLRRDYPEYTRREAEVLVIGPDSRPKFQAYWEEHDLPFPGIPDPRRKVLTLYGQEFKLLKFGRMPAQMLVDRQGIVLFVNYGDDMTDITPDEVLLALLDRLRQEEAAPPEGGV